ncbi:uncharacterized protein LOC113363326 isoform X2 [Ctenocephalides felis]|uniref:uncharacterized protein LOC113363326 isoform X2 n=1 Tax=Ctenocephalides felis TaxID=7515 RepID=UPI000E6E2D24|nr:uncharacterized protein LOC113363326 isoform X2 [Ctenocephalides felis]
MMSATGVAALVAALLLCQASCSQHYDSLCAGTRERYLSAVGEESSIVLPLSPIQNIQGVSTSQSGPCRARITAPDSHAIGLRLVGTKTDTMVQKPGSLGKSSRNHHGSHQKGGNGTLLGCPLSVYLPEDRQSPVWRFDPCLGGAQSGASKLLPDRVSIAWSPPEDGSPVPLALVATAVGNEERLCREKGRHVCVHIGRKPLLCISDHLVCDGIKHCPLGNEGDGDEDPRLCERSEKPRQNTWDMITLAILRRLASARPAPIEHVPPKDFAVPSKTEKESNEASGVDKTVKEYQIFSGLSQYGPWGFLLIGVLICGVMLLICGLWECYCRRPQQPSPPLVDPCASISPDNHVVASNLENISPPLYDELDTPPAYNILFPPEQKSIPVATTSDQGTSSGNIPV